MFANLTGWKSLGFLKLKIITGIFFARRIFLRTDTCLNYTGFIFSGRKCFTWNIFCLKNFLEPVCLITPGSVTAWCIEWAILKMLMFGKLFFCMKKQQIKKQFRHFTPKLFLDFQHFFYWLDKDYTIRWCA